MLESCYIIGAGYYLDSKLRNCRAPEYMMIMYNLLCVCGIRY